MKRALIFILTIIVIAGWLGTLIARDPGYVLIAYDDYNLQSSLWVMLALLAIIIGSIYYVMRLLKLFVMGPATLRSWRSGRKEQRAQELTRKGLTLLATGEHARAEKFLISGIVDNENPGINYLAAAKAADAQQNGEQRESMLRLAVESDPGLADASAIAAAEMAVTRGEWQRCLDYLGDVKSKNDIILLLQKRALYGLQDWQRLTELLPALRRVGNQPGLVDFEREIVLRQLVVSKLNDKALGTFFNRLSDEVRHDPEVILSYVHKISEEKIAEQRLRQALKLKWDAELVLAYGKLGEETVSQRIKQAESWRKQHDDAALNMALAVMYRLAGDSRKSRDACQRSIDLAPSRAANELLASFLVADGDHAGSNDLLKQALSL